jgi:hypothetical protein
MKKKEDRLPFGEIGSAELEELYEWDMNDAIEAQKLWEVEHPQGRRGPLYQWLAAGYLEEHRQRYVAGDENSILPALFECAMDGLPIPAWCAQAFINAFREVKTYRAKSWDDVFGSPHPKGTQLGSKKNQREKEFKVYMRISAIKKCSPSTPIDVGLFEKIGKELGICKTLASQYYYSAKQKTKRPIPVVDALLEPFRVQITNQDNGDD